ncbi:MAG TPA: translation elongation factor Ts [Bryobacteraceae bacterium]|nr:translation elongation factor Ts [Bryobacteraceae bacterium]
MAEITAAQVKQLRDKTGAGMSDCKKALQETNGNFEAAVDWLRKKGIASASKKASRATRQGVIGTYIHPGAQLGVMVEINCESDFVARTDDFQQLVHDVAMQIAAADPLFLRKEDVTPEVLEREKNIAKERARAEGKPDKILDKIVEGRLAKYYEEVCLLEQPFIKDNSLTVTQLVASVIAKLGENITIARFVRFKVGDTGAAGTSDSSEGAAETSSAKTPEAVAD